MLQLTVTFKNKDVYTFGISKLICIENFIKMLAEKRNWILTDEAGTVFVINFDEVLFVELSASNVDENDEDADEGVE